MIENNEDFMDGLYEEIYGKPTKPENLFDNEEEYEELRQYILAQPVTIRRRMPLPFRNIMLTPPNIGIQQKSEKENKPFRKQHEKDTLIKKGLTDLIFSLKQHYSILFRLMTTLAKP